jgi:serine/threonine-protein kinase
MDAERWQRLSPLLDALIELDAEARAARLAELRAEDAGLAEELEGLLALEEDNADFLAEPLVAPPPSPKPDTLLGPYRLDRMLGEGGMGQVWLARRADGLYQRRVALKLLRPGLADPNLRQRFTRERQILARLGHPHIARLLDAGISSDNQPYLALEYVDGEPITDWCRGRDLDIEARLRLFLQVCEAVSHAHANLIVHRDLKPSNILVTPLDEVRLLDFGIAKLLDGPEPGRDHTRTEVRAFTLHYAAPEQIRGEPVTTMTDVYALGVVLYELLAESKPYRLSRQSDAAWEEAILLVDPQKPSLNLLREADSDPSRVQQLRRRARTIAGDLDNIVLKALAKRAEHRYASVEALAQDLQRYLEGKPVLARPQSLAYRSRKFVQRHRWALATGGLILAVLAAAMVLVTWQAGQAVREATRARALQDFVIGLFEQAGGGTGPLDVRQLLADGEERGNTDLKDQPQDRAELLGVIARLRLSLGDYEDALRLLRQQDALLKSLPETPMGLRVTAATDFGRTLRLLGNPAQCSARMLPLEEDVRGEQGRIPGLAAEFFSELGRCQRALDRAASARLLFQRSLAIRRNMPNGVAGVAENLGDLADLAQDAGDNAGALSGYRNALALLESRFKSHPIGIDLRRRECALERKAGDLAAAESTCHAALTLALARRGAEHPETVDARRELAAIHVDLGRFREADAAFRDSRRWLAARLGAQHPDLARDDNSLGIIAWERGDTETALRFIDRALATLRKQPNGALYPGVLFNKAMILHEAGRDREALALLRDVERLRIEQVGDKHPLLGDHARLLGEVQAALGQREAARASLERAVQLTRGGYGLSHPHTRRTELAQALLALDGDGDAEARRAALRQLELLSQLPQSEAELRKVDWLATAALAHERCVRPDALDAALRAATAGGAAAVEATTTADPGIDLIDAPAPPPDPREVLDQIKAEIDAALPEGGFIARSYARIRSGCR